MNSWILRTLARIRAVFLKSEFDRQLEEEFDTHIAIATEENIRRGMKPADARREALFRFGGRDGAMEMHREARGIPLLETLVQDVTYACRQLQRYRTFTAVTVLTLALGIGANTAIFSIFNSLMLRPLPVADPEDLVIVRSGVPETQGSRSVFSHPMWEQISRRAENFDGAAAWVAQRFDLGQSGERDLVDGVYASDGFFTALGVSALLGRTFVTADDMRSSSDDAAVAVISYRFWQDRFGGAADVIGKSLSVERMPFTIIGVTAPDFFGVEVGRVFDVALPLRAEPLIRGNDSDLDEPARSWLTVMLRLREGQSRQAASAALNAALPQMLEVAMTADILQRIPFLPFTLEPAAAGTSLLRSRYERPVLTILIVVALVLLVACVNITNLLLARAASRRHELSIRLALGASRRRLVRQLMIESMLIAAAGAILGIVVAAWGSRTLVAQLSTTANRVFLDLTLDWRVMAFTAAVTIATVLLFGTVPAFRATRIAPGDVLKHAGRGAVGGNVRLLRALVVVQVAISLVLVVACGLFVKTFDRLTNAPIGFDPDGVLLVSVDMTRANIAPSSRISFYYDLANAAAAVPGVSAAAASLNIPLSGINDNLADVPGAMPTSDDSRYVRMHFVTPGWFAAYGIPIRLGRDIDARDNVAAPPVALINDAFVRKFLPGRNAIGSPIAYRRGPGGGQWRTVIGVVGDAIYGSLREDVQPTIYLPLAQQDAGRARTDVTIAVRSLAGSPALLAPSVGSALTRVEPDLAFSFQPLGDRINGAMIPERLLAMLSVFFGALALLLALLGLYGITAYFVSCRRSEIGIRMSLGANPRRIARFVLLHVFVLVALGVAIGAALSLWVSRWIVALLYGIGPRDPSTLIGAAALLVVVSALAAWLPTRRAARIDPAEVLRSQ